MRTVVLIAGLVAVLALAVVALATGPPFTIPGVAWNTLPVQVLTTTSMNAFATTCRIGGTATGQETPGLLQVIQNAVYFTLDGTAVASTASYYILATGDWLFVQDPSRLRLTAGAATGQVVLTCLQ